MNQKRKSILSVIFGNALEYYDVTLYGFFAVSLAPLFFPSETPLISVISSFAAFSSAFLMRPLGGLVFGYFGDKLGRRKVLLWTIVFMSLSTLCIGLLPTYEKIGCLSPILLITLRLFQGFCAGGEYGGAAVYVFEQTKPSRRGIFSSLLSVSGFMGGLLGTTLSIFSTSLFASEWGWRAPFIIGGILGVVVLYLRRHIKESPAFLKPTKNRHFFSHFKNFIASNKSNIFVIFCIGGAAVIPYYILSVYMNKILIIDLGFSLPDIMKINSSIMVFWIICLPIMGHLSDRIGHKKLMLISSVLTAVLAIPLFHFLHSDVSLSRVLIFQVLLSLISISFVAPTSAFIPKLFGTENRYIGVAFSYSLGAAILGGTTPLIATLLVDVTSSIISPAYYLCFGGCMGILCLLMAKPTRDNE